MGNPIDGKEMGLDPKKLINVVKFKCLVNYEKIALYKYYNYRKRVLLLKPF